VEAAAGDPLVALLGTPTPESTRMVALTLTEGDPTWAGPLAGVPLGLPVVHVTEPDVKALVPADVWTSEVGLAEHALDTAAIRAALEDVRTRPS
jgi:glycine reductase